MNTGIPLTQKSASSAKIVAAFTTIYLLWGSTYLAMQYAIETIPPFLMAGIRFLIAGSSLFCWVLWRAPERPKKTYWLTTAVTGGLLLCGIGIVAWAEQLVPSG